MTNIPLQTLARVVLPLLWISAVFLFLRGHNFPGGGFVAGLAAGAGYTLVGLSWGSCVMRRSLGVQPTWLLGAGLFTAVVSGLVGPLTGGVFMQGRWWPEELPVIGKAGTPVLFDAGVFLVVLGTVVLVATSIPDSEDNMETST